MVAAVSKAAWLCLFVVMNVVSDVSPAYAGIETAATALVVNLLWATPLALAPALAGTIGVVTAANAILTAVVVGGLYAANVLLRPSLPDGSSVSSIDPSAAKQTFTAEESPELNAVGRVRVGGLKAFGNTNGANRYRVILHCKGEIEAFEEYYLGGREVTVDPDGSVTSPPWVKIGGSWCYINGANGTGSETAWADLISEFPDVWTSDHRARGIAQSLIKYISPGLGTEKFLALFQSGVPDLEVVIRAANSVYDPRTATSGWTENGVLNVTYILLRYPEIAQADIDMDFIADEADRADVAVDTLTGITPRARCSGVWSSETPRGGTMKDALDSIGAWIIPRDGGTKLGIQLIDDVPEPDFIIQAMHTVSLDFQSGPSAVERPNVCRVKYYSPERNYAMAEIDLTGIAWARIDDEVTAYGEKFFDVELKFCPDASQAQRIARRMFALARSDSGVIKANYTGMGAFGRRIAAIELPDDLGDVTVQIAAPRVLDDEGTVEIPFVVWPTLTPWDTEVDEAPAPDPIPDLAYGSPLTVPDEPAAATVVTYQGANGSATRLFYTIPIDAPSIEATYRTYTAGLPNAWTSMTEVVAASGLTHAYVPIDLSGLTVDFRVRTYDGDDTVSIWSDTLQVAPAFDNTAPGLPIIEFTPGTLAIVVRAPDSRNVAYLALSGSGAPTNQKALPGEDIADLWNGSVGTSTAQAKSTNGTGGATATLKIDAAGGGDTTKTVIAGTPRGSGVVKIWWRSSSITCDSIHFTGSGVPSDISCVAGTVGNFTISGLSPGSYTFTAESLFATLPTDTGPASITLTVT